MSQRRGFRLDANTMGLTTPIGNPPTPQEAEQEQTSEPPKTQGMEQLKSKLERVKQDMLKKIEQGNLNDDVPSTGQQPSQFNEDVISTDYYRNEVKKLRDICTDGTMNYELNMLFLQRLDEIDSLDSGDSNNNVQQKRLSVFQDWVDLLLQLNFLILGNLSDMEMELYEKIMKCFQSVRGEEQQSIEENRKLRKDICAIIKLVQGAYHHNAWNTDNMCLETLTVNQLLGIRDSEPRPESETEKVNKCMKSLANEVAAKHDEVCYLKTQLVVLDEIVQTARQKLILKDKCIAQLNQQLMELKNSLSKVSQDSNDERWPNDRTKDCSIQVNNFDSTNSLFDGLHEKDQHSNNLLSRLNSELSELIELITKQEYQAMEHRKKQLFYFFEKFNFDHTTALRKLDTLRNELRSLDCNVDHLGMPYANSTDTISIDDCDRQLIEALRYRLQTLNECNKELNDRCQHLESDYKVKIMEMQCNYDAERSISQKNSEVLKEIADQLSKLRCVDLSYNDIYTKSTATNPFCVAITELYERLHELEENKQENLLEATEDCPHRQQLEHTLLHCRTQSEMLQATRDNYLSIIVEFQRDLEELTEQVEQQEQQNEQIAKEAEDTPPIDTSQLETQNELLVCQLQNLKLALRDREQHVEELRRVISGYGDYSETNQLKDEISVLKQINAEQTQKICEIATLIKVQEDERQKLCKNYDNLLSNSEDQCKDLRRAKKEVQSLLDRLVHVEQLQEELKKERDFLREEVVALKQKDAMNSGRDRALHEQLALYQKDLEKSRCLLHEAYTHLKQEKQHHEETVGRLYRANDEIRQQLHALGCECKQIRMKLKQQTIVNEQQRMIIDSFRQWKDAQLRSDEAMRQCIKQAEYQLCLLLDENQRLCGEYKHLHGDVCLLEGELRRVKNAVNWRSTNNDADAPSRTLIDREDLDNRLRFIFQTSQRLAQQCRSLNFSDFDLPRISTNLLSGDGEHSNSIDLRPV